MHCNISSCVGYYFSYADNSIIDLVCLYICLLFGNVEVDLTLKMRSILNSNGIYCVLNLNIFNIKSNYINYIKLLKVI